MIKFTASIKKELLLLLRDKAGLAILFIMPLALIVIMALLQDGPFKDYQQADIPVLLIDQDGDSLGMAIDKSFGNSGMFRLEKQTGFVNEKELKEKVAEGKYKVAILIPPGTSLLLRTKIETDINNVLNRITPSSVDRISNIKLYWDPEIKLPVKNALLVAIDKIVSGVQASITVNQISKSLALVNPAYGQLKFNTGVLVGVSEENATLRVMPEFTLNSVQHNVPAWSVFGIFFIVLPLAGSIIKEREDGTMLRLRTMPVSLFVLHCSKVIAYLLVALIQFTLMTLAGMYLMPLLGLDALNIGNNFLLLIAVVLCIGLSATGYGLLIGTVFRTHQQASTFAAVSVVILAAIGGIWIPVFVMPDVLKKLSLISPLGWSMNGLNDIILRGGGLKLVLPELLCLLGFFGIMVSLSVWYDKTKNYIN